MTRTVLALFLLFTVVFTATSPGLASDEWGEWDSPKNPNLRALGGIPERIDAVVISGKELGSLLGADLDNIQVYSANALGELKQIPYQIDERFNQSGELALLANAMPGTDRFSVNDELVFMARDAGSRVHPASLAHHHQLIKEVEVTDPVTGYKAWVYVVRSRIPPLHSPVRYIQFDSKDQSVLGSNYYLDFEKYTPNSQTLFWSPNHLAFSWEKDPSSAPSLTPNLIQENFLKVQLASLGGLFSWEMNPQDLEAKEIGSKSGSIRTIRKIRLHPKLGMGFSVKAVTLIQTFYDQFMTTEISGDLSGIQRGLLSKMDVSFGQIYFDRFIPRVQKVEGRDLIYVQIANSKGRQAHSYWRLLAQDEVKKAMEPFPKNSECKNCLSYQLDAKKLPKGPFQFKIIRYFPTTNSSSEMQALLALDDQPLKIKIRTITDDLVFGRSR